MTSAIAPSAPEHWLHSFDIWATTMLMRITATATHAVTATNTERGLILRPSVLTAQGLKEPLAKRVQRLFDRPRPVAGEQEREDSGDHRQGNDHYAQEGIGQRGEVDVQQYADQQD